MSKALRAGVYILAAYGGCVLIDKKATKWLYSHKDEIVDKISKKIEKLIFGTSKHREKKPDSRPIIHEHPYRNIENILFDADQISFIFRWLQDEIDENGFITVHDICDLLCVGGTTYMDTQYGWTSIDNWTVAVFPDEYSDIPGKCSANLIPDRGPVRIP